MTYIKNPSKEQKKQWMEGAKEEATSNEAD